MEGQKCDFKIVGLAQIGPKGQIVIPKDLRQSLNLNPGDNLVIILKDNKYMGLVKNEHMQELLSYIETLKD